MSDGRAGFRRYWVGTGGSRSDQLWVGGARRGQYPVRSGAGFERYWVQTGWLGPYADVLGRPVSGSGSWVEFGWTVPGPPGGPGFGQTCWAVEAPWPGRAEPLCALNSHGPCSPTRPSPGVTLSARPGLGPLVRVCPAVSGSRGPEHPGPSPAQASSYGGGPREVPPLGMLPVHCAAPQAPGVRADPTFISVASFCPF